MPRSVQKVHRVLGDAGNLAGVIEMSVHHDVLVQLAAQFQTRWSGHRSRGDSVRIFCGRTQRPLVAVTECGGCWGGRKSSFADHLDLVRLEIVNIAAADDDVLQFRARANVGESFFPALRAGGQAELFDDLGVPADRVAAGCKTGNRRGQESSGRNNALSE